MPYILGCCCISPCESRNIIRYQHRIAGNDLAEECCIPILFSVILAKLFYWPCFVFPGAFLVMQSYLESKSITFPSTVKPQYLSSTYFQQRSMEDEARTLLNDENEDDYEHQRDNPVMLPKDYVTIMDPSAISYQNPESKNSRDDIPTVILFP
jgi:hypothetical protein